MDRVSRDVRSRTMASIKGRGTTIEKTLETLASKTRFSLLTHPKWLGSPDLAFPNRGVVVFLDSCFWHRCPAHYRSPKSRAEYWSAKIERNVYRDAEIRLSYQRDGWLVVQFWEHAILENPNECFGRLLEALRSRRHMRLVPPPPRRTKGGGVPFHW